MIPLTLAAALALVACGDNGQPQDDLPDAMQPDSMPPDPTLDEMLAEVITQQGAVPLPEKPVQDPALVTLGQALFFDRELGGNRDVSCASCHHPGFATGDALSLPVGVGGTGVGPERELPPGGVFVPRNATEVFNRGYEEWTTVFWDNRISGTPGNFTSPPGANVPASVNSALAIQALLPSTARNEMRGYSGDVDVFGNVNELALVADGDWVGIWSAVFDRLMAIPEYQDLFTAAFPGVNLADMDFGHAATAMAAFQIDAYTFTESPWDRYLRGELDALTDPAKRGALVFYGKGNCGACHSGMLLTDQVPHVSASPQLGPGRFDPGGDDFGYWLVTQNDEDRYKFRTPPLRNVSITGPWFHAGAYTTLEGAVRHCLDPATALRNYDVTQLSPAAQAVYRDDPAENEERIARLDPLLQTPIELTQEEFDDLMAFMYALTDPAAEDLSGTRPASVPSGLPLD